MDFNQDGCVYRSYVEQRLRERGQAMKVEVEVIGLELQKKLTQLGLGVALLPKNFVGTELQQGRLKPLRVAGEKLQTYSYVVFRTDRYFHRPMKAFLKLLQESFARARKPLDAVIANHCPAVDFPFHRVHGRLPQHERLRP